MDRITGLLNKRLGGIPAWLWGVIIGGSVALYVYVTRGDELGVPDETIPFVDEFSPADAGDISGIPEVIENDINLETNPAWIRYVTDRLRIDGEDPILVNNALTKVLAGLPVTAKEAAMWNLIVTRFGPPPEGAPPIEVIPDGPPSTNPPPSTGLPALTGLRVTKRGNTQIELAWNKVTGATAYHVQRVAGGAQVTVTKTSYRSSKPLARKTTYVYQVRGVGSGGKTSPWATVTVRTT